MKGFIEELEEHFSSPQDIDQNRYDSFIKGGGLSDPPPLTEAEEGMLEKVLALKKLKEEKGKRVKGSLKDDADIFEWFEGHKMWGAYSVVVDKSVQSLLATQLVLDTYQASSMHKKKQGDLPREVIQVRTRAKWRGSVKRSSEGPHSTTNTHQLFLCDSSLFTHAHHTER